MLPIVQYTDYTPTFYATVDDIPIDLSTADNIEISVKQAAPETLYTRTLAAGEVTISGTNNEYATADFTPAQTGALAAGYATVQMRVLDASGIVLGDVAEVVKVAKGNSSEAL